MTTKALRQIIHIDEEKCDGCGVCVPACVEGALQIIDGKAKLISEIYCDGLGACLGHCPQDAITIEEREAAGFNEEATEQHQKLMSHLDKVLPHGCPSSAVSQFEAQEETAHHHQEMMAHLDKTLPCGCPSTTVTQFEEQEETGVHPVAGTPQASTLRQWPVQLTLVPPSAPFLQGADLMLTADCVPFAYAGFHQDYLRNHALLIACPKLDDFQAHQSKLTDIFTHADVKSLTVVHMEVPCCSGLVHIAQQAIRASGKDIPLKEITIGVRGEVKA